MHLVSTLNAGIAAAANGWAEVYIRGTSTRATVYYDFEASTSDSSGDNIDLDAYGAVEVYVNQLVDVIAKSPDGTVIRSWTDGYASPNIEVISPSFSGNDYVSGAGGVNEPTTLQAVLNRWVTSSGSFDWKVSIGGAATDLDDAFGILTGLLFNVKSPEYGAVGDGVTNDQAAILAALADAVAAGGGVVFFPVGTYLVSTAIEWDQTVSMVGAGAGLSVVTTDSVSNSQLFTITSGTVSSAPLLVAGMSFASSVTNTGTQWYTSAAVNMAFERCRFNSTPTSTGIGMDVAGNNSRVSYRDCEFLANGSLHALVGTSGSTTELYIDRCRFRTTSTSFGAGLYRHDAASTVTNCVFDISTVTSGTNTGIESASGENLSVTNCRFATNSTSFAPCISLLTGMVANVTGCNFGSSTPYGGLIAGSGSYLQLGGRARATGAGAAFTVTNGASLYELVSTGTAPTITLPSVYFPDQHLSIYIINNSGGNWASITFSGTHTSLVAGATAVNNGQSIFLDCVVADLASSGTYIWHIVGVRIG